MCKIMAEIEEKGREAGLAAGRAAGLAEGVLEGQRRLILQMLAKGKTTREVAELTDLSLDEVETILRGKSA